MQTATILDPSFISIRKEDEPCSGMQTQEIKHERTSNTQIRYLMTLQKNLLPLFHHNLEIKDQNRKG